MQQLEKPLDDSFKKLPQLPENARKGLATALPWLTLAGGVLSLLGAWYLYQAVTWVDKWAGYANSLYGAAGYTAPVTGVSAMAWVGLAILVVQAILFFVAFPALRTYKKSGWNLLLWVALVSVVYSVVVNVLGGYFNLGQFIISLIGAAVGLYLLFQVRPYYTAAGGAAPVAHKTATPVHTEKSGKTDDEPKV